MRAQNLTISIPNKGCDKKCPYCVSRMTGDIKSDQNVMRRNIKKVLTMARAAQVTSVLMTGKGEPFLNAEEVVFYSNAFSEFPIEVQTNGIWLASETRWISNFAAAGVNIISFSVDGDKQPENFGDLIERLHQKGILVRITYNVTKKLDITGCPDPVNALSFQHLVGTCQGLGADQMTLRNICVPNNTAETEETKWIKENTDQKMYDRLKGEMIIACKKDGFLVRSLLYGSKVYDYDGLSISYSDYCIQDENNTEDIRSLIYMEDGGLYTSWNSRASRLF